MKKDTIKYGVINIPPGSVLCTLEKGGDKDNQAQYRFASTGQKNKKKIVALVSNETTMQDLYGDTWAHTKNGWIKAQNYITWYDSYIEASNAYASITNRKQKITIVMLLSIAIIGIIYLVKKIKNSNYIQNTVNDQFDDFKMDQ